MTGFDAAAWVDKAIAARMEPMAVIRADGRQGMWVSLVDRDHELAPDFPQSKEDLGAVIDVLVSRGAVVKAPPLPEHLRAGKEL